MKTLKASILPLAAVLSLASCGGGSDSKPSFEGVYAGSYTDGAIFDVVLEDGSFWSLYGPLSDKGRIPYKGLSKGQVTAKDGKFTVNFTNFDDPGNKVSSGTGSGTYSSSSAVGTATTNGTTVTFDVTKLPSQNYVYDTKARIASIVGTWKGKLLDGEESTISIRNDGTFSATSSNKCEFNGKFEPRPSGVNIFNVTLNFGGTPCIFPNQKASGIALTVLSDDAKSNALLSTVVLDSMEAGSIFSAIR